LDFGLRVLKAKEVRVLGKVFGNRIPNDGSSNLPTRTNSVVTVVYEAKTPDFHSGESGATRTVTLPYGNRLPQVRS